MNELNQAISPRYPLVGVGVFVFDERGRILVGRRLSKYGNGFFSMPGGKVDWNEPVRETVIRETREETALELKPDSIEQIGYCDEVYPEYDMHFVTLYWMADAVDISVLCNTEPTKCDGWGWVYPDRISEMKSIEPVWPQLLSFLSSPTGYLVRKRSYEKQLANSSL